MVSGVSQETGVSGREGLAGEKAVNGFGRNPGIKARKPYSSRSAGLAASPSMMIPAVPP
jgi:hypothetical protein